MGKTRCATESNEKCKERKLCCSCFFRTLSLSPTPPLCSLSVSFRRMQTYYLHHKVAITMITCVLWPDDRRGEKQFWPWQNLQIVVESKRAFYRSSFYTLHSPLSLAIYFSLSTFQLSHSFYLHRLVLILIRLGSTFRALNLQFLIWFQIIYSSWRHRHTHKDTHTEANSNTEGNR